MLKKTAVLFILAIFFNAFFLVFVWARHMFVTGLNPYLGTIALLLSQMIGIPLALFAVKRLARYCKGKIRFDPVTLFALGFFIFLIGDVFHGLVYGHSTLDIQLHDTYFVIAHAHVMLFFALLFLAFSAVYFYYPRIAGRVMNALMGYIHFGLTLVASCMCCWPVRYDSLVGMPRRYMDYSNWTNMDQFAGTNVFITRAIILLICAQVLFIVNLIYSAVKGKKWTSLANYMK